MAKPTVGERLARYSDQSGGSDSCWPWLRSISAPGYGRIGIGRRVFLAHRVSYELANGPIPPGMVIDHLCRNRRCVNPKHLEAVTSRENTYRGESLCAQNRRKLFCTSGHEYTPDNTRAKGVGKRGCRICDRASNNRSRRKRREDTRTINATQKALVQAQCERLRVGA